MDGGVEAEAMGALDKVAAMGGVEGVAACHRAVEAVGRGAVLGACDSLRNYGSLRYLEDIVVTARHSTAHTLQCQTLQFFGCQKTASGSRPS